MASNCGYHSPQFSEDITWLPAWLQPHHPPPNLGDSAKDGQAISCKNEASFKENTSNGQGGLLFTNDDAKYSNCHLYFSGEDNSPAESTPGQALHFCLHLSSVGTSLISSGQLNEVPQIGNCETNGSSFMKYLETPEVHGDTSYLCKINDAPASESPVSCKPRRSPILISQALIKGDQNNRQRFQEKLDDDNLGSVDIIDVELLQTGKYENEGSSWEHIPETPAVQNDTRCQFKMNNGPPVSDMSPVGSNQIPVSEPVTKADQNNCHRFHGKIDAGKLKTANIDDAVELSIAASEAMVISEIVSSSFPSELLPATTILEIALRVRQARNQCYSDISEADSGISDKLDETDQLCDLDEDIMADAFDDVGLSVTQSVGTPLFPLQQQQILQSTFSCDLNTHVSESNCGCKDEAQRNHLRSHNVEINRTTSQVNNAFSCKLESNNLLLEHLAVQQTKSTFLLPMGYNTSCLRNQPMAHTSKLIHNVDDLTAIQMDSKDDPAILKESKVTPERGANLKKSTEEFFNGESSFISESVDDMDECTPELGLEAEPDIVASSSTPFGDLIKHTYNESERSIHEGLFSSHDIVRSSILSLADPLCSIVPCSISSYDDPMKKTEENGKKFINSTAIVGLQKLNSKSLGLQNLNTKTIVPNPQETLPSTPLDQGGDCVLSKISIEGSGVPRRKQFSSLKPYSMVMPCHKTAGEIIYQNKWGSLHNMDEKIPHLFPTEENTNCFACDKDDLRLKSMYKCVVVDGPNNSLDLGSKDNEKVNGSYAIGETEDADIGMPAQCSEERSSPLILNKKKCRLQACKIVLNCDGEDETFKVSSASNLRKFRLENSMNEISGKDQTNITSCDPQQSYLGSYAANKHLLSDKKVHFLEPKTSIDRTKTGGRPQSGYNICSSQRRTRKKVKECSLRCKTESRKELYNSLKRWSMIRGKGMILQGLEFLLTGFSSQKEKELEALIRKYGGYVLSNIPSPNLRGKRRVATASLKLPIVLSPKKVHTTKFLYGCATNTWILNANWLVDSVQAGSVLPPGRYMTRPIQSSMRSHVTIGEPLCFDNGTFIFDRVGVMLYGKASFCTKFSKIVKHGGGQVFKSLQLLVQSLENGKNTVGAIVVENEHRVSRHLEYCALEHNLQTVPAIWIINSLFSGKLLPFKKDRCAPLHRIKMPTFPCVQAMEMSEEI